MLTKRIIPCLDVRDGVVIKGVQFRNHRVMGDILELAQRYRDEGADELVFYDITASSDSFSKITRVFNPTISNNRNILFMACFCGIHYCGQLRHANTCNHSCGAN